MFTRDDLHEYIQDSFDIIQEASSKTKTRRMKTKLRKLAKADDTGNGSVTDRFGNSVDIKLKFPNNEPTHVDINYDTKTSKFERTLYVNQHGLGRSSNAIPAFTHEKNHILLNNRRKRTITPSNTYQYAFTEDRDKYDESLVKAFINRHRKDITGKHTLDPDEYLADLNSARELGFNKIIKMLEDLRTDKYNIGISPQAKHYMKEFKNKSKQEAERLIQDKTVMRTLKSNYQEMLNQYKSEVDFIRNPGANAHYAEQMKHLIEIMENQLESDESFIKAVRDKTYETTYLTLRNQYNQDLKMRIMFLKEMKKIDDEYWKRKSIRDNHAISESYDMLDLCIYHSATNCLNRISHERDEYLKQIHGVISDTVDCSKYSNEDIDEMVTEAFAYSIISSLEEAMKGE